MYTDCLKNTPFVVRIKMHVWREVFSKFSNIVLHLNFMVIIDMICIQEVNPKLFEMAGKGGNSYGGGKPSRWGYGKQENRFNPMGRRTNNSYSSYNKGNSYFILYELHSSINNECLISAY